jgi:hypothetical protein
MRRGLVLDRLQELIDMTINVAQFGMDLAAKLMAKNTGVFQGMTITYHHRTASPHTPGVPYTAATFVEHPTPINGILAAPGANAVQANDPATLHMRRVLVRSVELPSVIAPGDRWTEPSGETYEVTALPWGDPSEATLWLVGERSTAP